MLKKIGAILLATLGFAVQAVIIIGAGWLVGGAFGTAVVPVIGTAIGWVAGSLAAVFLLYRHARSFLFYPYKKAYELWNEKDASNPDYSLNQYKDLESGTRKIYTNLGVSPDKVPSPEEVLSHPVEMPLSEKKVCTFPSLSR